MNAFSTFQSLAMSTALTTLASVSGKASTSVFIDCWRGSTGRGGFAGGISVASSEKRTPGLGDLEVGGGDEMAGASSSSSKSSSRAVVGDSLPVPDPRLEG